MLPGVRPLIADGRGCAQRSRNEVSALCPHGAAATLRADLECVTGALRRADNMRPNDA